MHRVFLTRLSEVFVSYPALIQEFHILRFVAKYVKDWSRVLHE